jgi:hypothetical protein
MMDVSFKILRGKGERVGRGMALSGDLDIDMSFLAKPVEDSRICTLTGQAVFGYGFDLPQAPPF